MLSIYILFLRVVSQGKGNHMWFVFYGKPWFTDIWVRSRRCSSLVTWFCYHLIAKPGNKTAAPSWPDPLYICGTRPQWVRCETNYDRIYFFSLSELNLLPHCEARCDIIYLSKTIIDWQYISCANTSDWFWWTSWSGVICINGYRSYCSIFICTGSKCMCMHVMFGFLMWS